MLQKPIQDCTKNQIILTSTTSGSYLRADLLASFGSSHECCVCGSTDTDLQFFLQGTPGYCYDIPRGCPNCPGCDGTSSAYCIHDIGKVSSMNQKYHQCTKCPHWLHPPEVVILSDLTSVGAINVKHSIKTTTLPFQLLRSKEYSHCGFGFEAVVMMGLLQYEMSLQIILTHSGRYTTTASFHTTFSNAFS